MTHPESHTPADGKQAWVMRIINQKSMPEILQTTEFNNEFAVTKAINEFQEKLLAPETLEAFINIEKQTEADIADALDVPIEIIKKHLNLRPCLNMIKLYNLIFPAESKYTSVEDLLAEENLLPEKAIKHDTAGGEDIHREDSERLEKLEKEIRNLKRRNSSLIRQRDNLKETMESDSKKANQSTLEDSEEDIHQGNSNKAEDSENEKLKRKLVKRNKQVKTLTERFHDQLEQIRIDQEQAEMLAEEQNQLHNQLQKAKEQLKEADNHYKSVYESMVKSEDKLVKANNHLKQIAERLGVPIELDKILAAIDDNINTALNLYEDFEKAKKQISLEQACRANDLKKIASYLRVSDTIQHIIERIDELTSIEKTHTENLKQIASRIGVPDTLQHIIQRIEELQASNIQTDDALEIKRKIWLDGIAVGEAQATLMHEINQSERQKQKLAKQTEDLEKYLSDIEQELKNLHKTIDTTFK